MPFKESGKGVSSLAGNERRSCILQILSDSETPVPGTTLAKRLNVSRQVIVQDIALLRAGGTNVLSTCQGYLVQSGQQSRVFKLFHTESEVEKELKLIVDLGGTVKDVFVYHKVYGVLRAEMNIKSRLDIARYLEDIAVGKSNLLLNVTSGYHYHTVFADSEAVLDLIQEALFENDLLAPLKEYEPVPFGRAN